MTNLYLYGVPTAATTAYLERISNGGPIRIFTRQPLYLGSPLTMIVTPEEAARVTGAELRARVTGGASWYNPTTLLPEFDIVANVDCQTLQMPAVMRPYAPLTLDGNRSQPVRLFLRSVVDLLVADNFALTYTLATTTTTSDIARCFNPAAGDDLDSSAASGI